MLHAQADIVSRVISAMPSLFLLLSFETFLGQVKHAVNRSSLIDSIEQLTQQLDQKQQQVNTKLEQMLTTLHNRFNSERQKLLTQIEQLTNEVNTKQNELDTITGKIEQSRLTLNSLKDDIKSVKFSSIEQARQVNNEQVNTDRQNRLTQLLNKLRVNSNPIVAQLADDFNVSRNTIYNDINTLVEQGHISKNGEGYKVTK